MTGLNKLKIGRVEFEVDGLSTALELDGLSISGAINLRAQTGDDASEIVRAMKADLLGHAAAGDIIPVLSDGVAAVDGFYVLTGVTLSTQYQPNRIYSFELSLERILEGDIKFESIVTAINLANAFGITVASEPILAPPPHSVFDAGANSPASMVRGLAEGPNLRVYRDVTDGSYKYVVRPKDWYAGSCRFERHPLLLPVTGAVPGLAWAGEPNQLWLTNGLVRIRAVATYLELGFWDGSRWRDKQFLTGETVQPWEVMARLDNRPETATARYKRQATAGEVETLDVTIRRGMRGAMFFLSRSVAATLRAEVLSTPAGLTQTAERWRQSAPDGSGGHRLVFSSAQAVTAPNPALNRLEKLASLEFDVFIGLELAAAVAGDTALDLSMQYIGYVAEEVRRMKL